MLSSVNYGSYPQMLKGVHRLTKYNSNGNINNALNSSESISFEPYDVNSFLEPYGSYFEITIETANNTMFANDSTYANKMLALDGDAHALLSQIVIKWNGKEIERIGEADVLNRVLNDVNWGPQDTGLRGGEGAASVVAPSLPNSVLSNYAVPSANSGQLNQIKSWMPAQQTLTTYTDTSQRIYAFGITTTGSLPVPTTTQNNYPTQHCQVNNRLAFNPLGYNDTAVTYSAGSDITESYNDFSSVAGVSSSNIANGLNQYFSPDFCRCGFEPVFSKTVKQRYMNNGFVKTDYLTNMTFFIKLRSGFLGELMPIERYRLIPLWLLKGLTIEITFAQHAFYTSWYSTSLSSRAYQITNCKLHCTLFEPDYKVKDAVDQMYATKGLDILTQSWTLGPKQTFQGAVPASTSINFQFDSLRNLLFFFVPNDYQIATNVRKGQRFSMAVSKYQLRIGSSFFPLQEVTGNGGTNASNVNNYEMLNYTLACFSKHCGPSSCSINPSNFAISCTANDPTNAGLAGLNDNNQLSLFENNRVIGKAVYGIPLDKLNYNHSSSGGINTYFNTPFSLELSNNQSRVFPRNVTMYIYCHHDILIRIQPTGGVGGSVSNPEIVVVK